MTICADRCAAWARPLFTYRNVSILSEKIRDVIYPLCPKQNIQVELANERLRYYKGNTKYTFS